MCIQDNTGLFPMSYDPSNKSDSLLGMQTVTITFDVHLLSLDMLFGLWLDCFLLC